MRVVHREQVVALSGARALLMQAAHPIAFEGFLAQTGSLDTIGFGTKDRQIARPLASAPFIASRISDTIDSQDRL